MFRTSPNQAHRELPQIWLTGRDGLGVLPELRERCSHRSVARTFFARSPFGQPVKVNILVLVIHFIAFTSLPQPRSWPHRDSEARSHSANESLPKGLQIKSPVLVSGDHTL